MRAPTVDEERTGDIAHLEARQSISLFVRYVNIYFSLFIRAGSFATIHEFSAFINATRPWRTIAWFRRKGYPR
jgi:hypothetical protein